MNNWWGLLWQTRKEGLGNGHNQKKEVLGTGTTLPEKGGLRNGHNQKKGVLGTSRDKKGGSLPWHILVLCECPPPPPRLNIRPLSQLTFYCGLRRSRLQMGIFQCMISAASPPQNIGCERCLLSTKWW